MKLKPGLVVRIYSDPTTKEELEGLAQLMRLLDVDGSMQRWEVMFLKDKKYAERNILSDE